MVVQTRRRRRRPVARAAAARAGLELLFSDARFDASAAPPPPSKPAVAPLPPSLVLETFARTGDGALLLRLAPTDPAASGEVDVAAAVAPLCGAAGCATTEADLSLMAERGAPPRTLRVSSHEIRSLLLRKK